MPGLSVVGNSWKLHWCNKCSLRKSDLKPQINSDLGGCKISWDGTNFWAQNGNSKKKLGRIDGSQIVYPALTETAHDSQHTTVQMTIPASVQEAYILVVSAGNEGAELNVSVSKGSATLLKPRPDIGEQEGRPTIGVYYFQNTTGSASVCTSTATGSWPGCGSMYISL